MGLIVTPLFLAGILGLFLLDRNREAHTSIALWVPSIWLFVASSRGVSEWLPGGPAAPSTETADRYLDGNPFDRNFMTALLLIGLIVLIRRRHQIGAILKENWPILLFFSYCALSTLWSDYPGMSFKRWIKASGDLVMVLVVLTDADWLTAVKRWFARVGFFVVPLSVLFIRYYSNLGRAFDINGTPFWTGVATSKNSLGMVCLLSGLASLWRVIEVVRGAEGPSRLRRLIAHGTIIVLALGLILKIDSMTSFSCFALAGGVMVLVSWPGVARRAALVHVIVLSVISLAFCALFLNIGSSLINGLGRDASLTGRTEIWDLVLAMIPNRLVGAGFESFWIGDRLKKIWDIYWNHPNQAHDGYIEVYLNLGWIGVTLLSVFIINAYFKIIAAVRDHVDASNLRLAFFIIGVAYNFTEAAFKMTNPVWICFLFATTAVPIARAAEAPLPVSLIPSKRLAGYEVQLTDAPYSGMRKENT